jgi:hypothetical protein
VGKQLANSNLIWGSGFGSVHEVVVARVVLATDNKEPRAMTKKTPTLVELKLAVLNYYQATQDVVPNEQFIAGIARDECYTSHNSLMYKKKQMADKLADYETAVEEGKDIRADAIARLLDNMEVELTLLDERHQADLSVYEQVTGTQWEPMAKKRAPAKLSDDRMKALKAKVA